jgi:hypothetical protein
MGGWFDFAIADELHQLAGDTAQGNGLGVLGRAAKRLIALTGTLMGGYADDLFNIFYRMEPRTRWPARDSHTAVRAGATFSSNTVCLKPSRRWGYGQRLFAGDQEDDPGSEEAGSVAAAVRQVPDEHDGVSFARRHCG